eukprot:1160317-Pelagomonas_calceolata.AAC.12
MCVLIASGTMSVSTLIPARVQQAWPGPQGPCAQPPQLSHRGRVAIACHAREWHDCALGRHGNNHMHAQRGAAQRRGACRVSRSAGFSEGRSRLTSEGCCTAMKGLQGQEVSSPLRATEQVALRWVLHSIEGPEKLWQTQHTSTGCCP